VAKGICGGSGKPGKAEEDLSMIGLLVEAITGSRETAVLEVEVTFKPPGLF